MKIDNDKYYTPVEVANHCWEVVDSLIDLSKMKRIIEPSVGGGAFCQWNVKPTLCVDILPEYDDPSVVKTDFLMLDIPYEPNTLVIGNPPFGNKGSGFKKFFNKSILIGDYIAFILPISQLNNSNFLYKYNLIYSEKLANLKCSERNVMCCFNVYKRPEKGVNKKKKIDLKSVKIIREDKKGFQEAPFDVRMCHWGYASGDVYEGESTHVAEYKIKVLDESLKEDILHVLKTYDWKSIRSITAAKGISIIKVKEVLLKEVKGIY